MVEPGFVKSEIGILIQRGLGTLQNYSIRIETSECDTGLGDIETILAHP